MSSDLVAISYEVFDVGKIMKASKKKHQWDFKYKNKKFRLCVFESLKTGKFKLELNNKVIYEITGGKRSISKKVQDPRLGQITIEIMKITNNQYRLSINNCTFEKSDINVQNMFKYETYEEKQKKIQMNNNNKKEEDYFNIGKGTNDQGKETTKLSLNSKLNFGAINNKGSSSGLGKLNLGFNKDPNKKNLLKFDKGIFGKQGKFDEKNYFGNATNKDNKKKDIFSNDFFKNKNSSSNNTKKNTNFGDFDIFGEQQSSSNRNNNNNINKNTNVGFDDFGFGNQSSKNTNNNIKKNNFDNDFDIFGMQGSSQPKTNKGAGNLFGNSQTSSSSRNQNKFGSHFGNNQNDDFDIFGGGSKPSQPQKNTDYNNNNRNTNNNDLFDLNVTSNNRTQIQTNNQQNNNYFQNNNKQQADDFLDLDFGGPTTNIQTQPQSRTQVNMQHLNQIRTQVSPSFNQNEINQPQQQKNKKDFLDFGDEFDLVQKPTPPQNIQPVIKSIKEPEESVPEKILTDSLSPNSQPFKEPAQPKNTDDLFDFGEPTKNEFNSDKMSNFINTNGAEISNIDIKPHDNSQNLTNIDILDSPSNKTPQNMFTNNNNQFDFEKKKTIEIQKKSIQEIKSPNQEKDQDDYEEEIDFGFDGVSPVPPKRDENKLNEKVEAGFDDIFDQPNNNVFEKKDDKKEEPVFDNPEDDEERYEKKKQDIKKSKKSESEEEENNDEDDDEDDDDDDDDVVYQNAIYNNEDYDDDDDDDDDDEESYETYKKQDTNN